MEAAKIGKMDQCVAINCSIVKNVKSVAPFVCNKSVNFFVVVPVVARFNPTTPMNREIDYGGSNDIATREKRNTGTMEVITSVKRSAPFSAQQ